MSNLAQTHDGVQDHWSRLANQWRITLGLWNDPVRRRFEREYWQGYEPAILSVLRGIEAPGRVVEQAQREVK